MWTLIQVYMALCVILGCNAISYKIHIDDELGGAGSGKFYHSPLVILFMSLFYFLSVFIILGIAISLAFKITWWYAILLFFAGYFVAFQFIPKRLYNLVGSDSIYFSGIFTLGTLPGFIIYFISQYLKY